MFSKRLSVQDPKFLHDDSSSSRLHRPYRRGERSGRKQRTTPRFKFKFEAVLFFGLLGAIDSLVQSRSGSREALARSRNLGVTLVRKEILGETHGGCAC